MDGVVADAVVVELVSNAKFPANREINREFRQICSLDAILIADTRAKTKGCSEIPYATEQGIISEEQGILALEQGISAAMRQPRREACEPRKGRKKVREYLDPNGLNQRRNSDVTGLAMRALGRAVDEEFALVTAYLMPAARKAAGRDVKDPLIGARLRQPFA
jgi:hypothetical protein